VWRKILCYLGLKNVDFGKERVRPIYTSQIKKGISKTEKDMAHSDFWNIHMTLRKVKEFQCGRQTLTWLVVFMSLYDFFPLSMEWTYDMLLSNIPKVMVYVTPVSTSRTLHMWPTGTPVIMLHWRSKLP
jgi:hypothetical protein